MNSLLQNALRLHQAGDLLSAKKLYKQIIAANPREFNAQQLLGVLYGASGDTTKAISYMQQSLKNQPNQPNVFNNLGNVYKRSEQPDKALECYKNALKLKPDYLDAATNLATLLTEQARFKQASDFISESAVLQANIANKLRLEAIIHSAQSDYPAAIEKYLVLHQFDPVNTFYRHQLALNYRLNGESEQAITHYKGLLAAGFNHYAFFHNMANAYSDVGELAEAIEFYQKAIALNPGYLDSHINLNEILWETGKHDTFLASYKHAVESGHFTQELIHAYVGALIRAGDFQQAHSLLLNTPGVQQHLPEYLVLLGRAQKGLGDLELAISTQLKATALAECKVEDKLEVTESLIQAGDFQKADRLTQEMLSVFPFDRLALAYRTICLRKLGLQEVEKIERYDDLVRDYIVEPPRNYSGQHFFQDLTDYLVALHTADVNPLEQSLQGGTQTRGNLFNHKHPLIQQLVAQLKDKISHYLNHLSQLDHPEFVGINQHDYEFSGSWSVCLGKGGFHTCHVHPMGTFSSVFYLSLPDDIDNERDKPGWLSFGKPKHSLNTELEAKKFVKPAVGKLVLFPSYFWHGTIPFESDKSRITVAFDVKVKP